MHFLQQHDVGIVLLQETFLKPGTNFHIPNYILYRNDRIGRRGGGTAILVKRNIPHYHIPTPTLQNTEATIIKILMDDFQFLTISLYIPPNAANFQDDIKALFNLNGPILLAGDLNAHHRRWGSARTNHAGKIIESFLLDSSVLLLVPDEATHFHAGRQTIIDYGMTKDFYHNIRHRVLPELNSDHNPVLFIVENVFIDEPLATRKTTDWHAFRRSLAEEELNLSLISEQDVFVAVNSLSERISDAKQRHTKVSLVEKYNPYDLPNEIKKLIRLKNRVRRRARNTGDPSLRREANHLTRVIRDKISRFLNERWGEFLESFDPGDLRLWKLAKHFQVRNKTVMPPIRGTTGLLFNDIDKAEAFADSLELQFQENEADPNFLTEEREIKSKAREILNTSPNESDDPQIRPASISEIKEIIAALKRRKAPGHDNITNACMKNLPDNFIQAITDIINKVLQLRKYPDTWKEAIIILIPKPPKDLSLPQNWRPISLLPTISKITERVIASRLWEVVDDKQLIPDEQFGFRPQHSCELQLARVVQNVKTGLQSGRPTGLVMFDVAKAFDKVWHAALIVKMHEFKFPIQLILLIGSFLENRSFRVKIQKTLSSRRSIKAGVPQGSPIAALLYIIYTSDTPKTPYTKEALFADDTCIFATALVPRRIFSALQNHINRLLDYFRKWKIKINADKTQAIFISRTSTETPQNITVNNVRIPWKPTAKYLGLTIDDRLSWEPHIRQKRAICAATIDKLLPLIRNKKLNMTNKKLLYTQIIRPRLLYGCIAFCQIPKQLQDTLQAGQNIAIRRIFGIPWYIRNTDIHRDLNIDSVKKYIRDRALKLFEQIDAHENRSLEILKLPPNSAHAYYKKDIRSILN